MSDSSAKVHIFASAIIYHTFYDYFIRYTYLQWRHRRGGGSFITGKFLLTYWEKRGQKDRENGEEKKENLKEKKENLTGKTRKLKREGKRYEEDIKFTAAIVIFILMFRWLIIAG